MADDLRTTAAPTAPAADEHLVPLGSGWALWRDVAVRSTGFPIDGLDVFGPGDEPSRLQRVAADPRFREAVTWQNRSARANAIDKLAAGSPTSGSKRRQREELVASYWQRYCAKNDTIGFFGPLGWGHVVDDGPAIAMRVGRPDAVRSVHFETWGIQAIVDAFGFDLALPLGPHPERDARTLLDAQPASPARAAALAALDTLERQRARVVEATTGELDAALAALDAAFESLTSRDATQRPGEAYATRTLLYLDCMRDLDLAIGPGVVDELGRSLPALLAGGRWYCGQVFELGRRLIADAVDAAGGRGPAGPVVGPIIGRLLAGVPELEGIVAGLQRRWADLFADPDRTTLASRAERVFVGPRAWPLSVFHSPDVQVAAASAEAVEAGNFLCVVGDYHPGNNVLGQGLFARRHPDRARFLAQLRADAGEFAFLVPLRDAPRMSARIMPAITWPDDLHVTALANSVAPLGHRSVSLADLALDGSDLVDRDGSVRIPIEELLQVVIFVMGVQAYDPFPVVDHGDRITIGRTVLRRETWNVAVGAMPREPAAAGAWARSLGLPRRVFAKSPLELKPMYVDFESDVLTRILCRHGRRLAAERPEARMRFTEMLPGPEECWLTEADGRRFASELRLVAVDLEHRAAARE
jgi:hypothetical protein